MKTTILAAKVAFFSFALAFHVGAADIYWINPEGGDWDTASNWSTGTKPTVNDHVFVTNANAIAISTAATHSMKIGHLTVENGTLSLSSSGGCYAVGTATSVTSVFEVAEGATVVIKTNFRGNSSSVVLKTGGGTLDLNYAPFGSSLYMHAAIVVREGMLKSCYNYKPLNAPLVVVETGATLQFYGFDNQMLTSGVLELQEGATLDMGTKALTLGAIVGSGDIIKNVSGITLTLAGGPYRFDGTLPSGNVAFAPNYVAGTTEWILGGDALKNGATLSTTNAAGVAAMVKFADGCGNVPVPIGQIPEAAFAYEDGTPVQFAHYIAAGKTYNHTAAGDDHWTAPIFGEGTINEKSGGTWTIDSLSLTGGAFKVDASATGPSIVFGGGFCTNTTLTVSKADNYEYRFEGISLPQLGKLYGRDRAFYQTGGYVGASPLTATTAYTMPEATNEVFYYISGGTLVSRCNDYSMGLGLEASGDAHVVLENGSSGAHSITYHVNNINHTLRVKGNALVEVQDLNMYYYKGATCTATVEVVENGVLSVSGVFGPSDASYKSPSGFAGLLKFDGGTIRSTAAGSVTWPTLAMVAKDFDTRVFEGGMTVDVPADFYTRTLTWRPAISSGVESGTDGGLKKTGDGTLYLTNCIALTGPLTVRGGQLSVPALPCGTGAVTLDSGALTLRNAAAAPVGIAATAATRISFSGNSCLRLLNLNATVEIGSTEVQGATFARQGRGFLALAPGGHPGPGDTLDGLATRNFKVLGDDGTLLARNGTIRQPVFAMAWGLYGDAWGHNRGAKEVRLLTIDAETGCLAIAAPTATNSIPANADETTHVMFRDSSRHTVSANAHVGALEVVGDSLNIAAGAVLTVGEGAGTTAHMTLNNRHVVKGPVLARGKVTGPGALDFGAAEGIIAVNHAYHDDDTYAEAKNPAEIAAEIRGAGGISFYSPFNPDDLNAGGSRARVLVLSGANTYSGGTLVDNVIVIPRSASAFGGGTVELASHGPFGGQLLFDQEYADDVFTNALVLAGRGFGLSEAPSSTWTNRWGLGGAVSVEKNVSLTGGVTMRGDTAMRVADGATLTLGSAVTGDGSLKVFGDGTLALAAPISCSGGVEYGVGAVEIRPGRTGSLPLSPAQIPAGATLVAEGGGGLGQCGTLVIDGDVDLSTLNLRIVGRGGFRGSEFTVLRATGTISGEFGDGALPNDSWSLEYREDEVVLHHKQYGTSLMIL